MKRLRAGLAGAGLIMAASGAVMMWNGDRERPVVFEGEMWLAPGRGERHVLAPHAPGRETLTSGAIELQSNVPVHELPIPPEAQSLLPSGLRVDAARLPFELVLQSAELVEAASSAYVLVFQRADRQWEQAITAGQTIEVDGDAIEVDAIGPWGGLLREPDGPPMADVSVRLGDVWIDDVFLTEGEWVRVGDDLGIRMHWDDEPIPEFPAELRAARWGVVDGGAMQWTTSFAPGASFLLRDGRLVSLVGVEDAQGERPVLSVRVEGESTAELQVHANANDPEALVHFEAMGRLPLAVVLDVESFERARLAAYVRGMLADQGPIAAGETWEFADSGVAITLEQLERHALPLRTSDSPLVEARLRLGSDTVRIRQGESTRWGTTTVLFQRKTVPRSYVLSVEAGAAGELTLRPDAPVRVGEWVLEPARAESRFGGYTVKAKRVDAADAPWGAIGLMAAGVMVIVAAGWPRARRSL